MLKKILPILFLCGSVAFAQQKSSFGLQEAVDFALKNSPNALNSDLDLKNAVYKKNEIAGMGLPQINGSIDVKDYIEIPTSLLPGQFFGAPAGSYIPVKFGTKYNSTAGISASQLIFSSDYIIGLTAAKEYVKLYNPADVFVMDLCDTPNGIKIVEYNCWNCSGLYSVNISKLVHEVSNFKGF